jgi:lipopolysaccharide transport system ATP-binding protein
VGFAAAHELEAVVRDSIWAAPVVAENVDPGRLIAVAFYDAVGKPASIFRLGSTMTVKVAYRPAAEVPTHVALLVRNKFDQVITLLGSSTLGIAPPPATHAQAMIFEMSLDLVVEAGNYSIMASLSRLTVPNQGSNLDSSPSLGPVVVSWDYERETAPFLGMTGLPAQGAFKVLSTAAGDNP